MKAYNKKRKPKHEVRVKIIYHSLSIGGFYNIVYYRNSKRIKETMGSNTFQIFKKYCKRQAFPCK